MNARAQPVAFASTETGPFATHEVRNQARPSLGFNAFDGDRALSGLVAKIAPWAKDKLSALGAHAGCESVQEAARLANKHEPKLKTHDRFGNRIDWVEFHPAWHRTDVAGVPARGAIRSPGRARARRPRRARRAVLSLEPDRERRRLPDRHGLRRLSPALPQAAVCDAGARRSLAADYDPAPAALSAPSAAAAIGYAMTEKQGGSDLRQTQTTARFSNATAHGEHLCAHRPQVVLLGAAVADGFFTLAQTKAGVTCLFVPRFLPDGSAQPRPHPAAQGQVRQPLQRLERDRVPRHLAMLVGEEGRGIREILSHAHLTRLDFAIGSAGLMRQALTLALNHAQTRARFGSPLAEQPMMTQHARRPGASSARRRR